jgi:hypothetical protein
MVFVCNFCNNDFVKKYALQRHIAEDRCKSILIKDLNKINDIIQEYKNEIDNLNKRITTISGNNNITSIGNGNNINMKVEIIVNSINNLNVSYIENEKMKKIIENYGNEKELVNGKEKFNNDKMNIYISEYIKDMICDTEHPENHSVKYIKKKPPTYNTHIQDTSGNTVTVIKGLKDTCELLTDPILDQLKIKLKEFIKKYKPDTEPDFDYTLYENAIRELKKELNKQNVKKALKSVLQNDILNNIEMKLSLIEKL